MQLFVGLGNPGAKYQGNRHNIGFMVLDEIARRHGFAPWRPRSLGETSDGMLGGERVVLLKPTTFMNVSGQAVGEALRSSNARLSDIVVFHDEIELPPATLRTRLGGGNKGHNGLRSISALLGNEYRRICLGVGRPVLKHGVDTYVLSNFATDERAWLHAMFDAITANIELVVAGADSIFADRINSAMKLQGYDDDWKRHRVQINQIR